MLVQIPSEDWRGIDSERQGMLEGFTLGNYFVLVEHTGRLLREGKASISGGVALSKGATMCATGSALW